MNDKAVAVREESRALSPVQERNERIRAALVERLPGLLPAGMSPDRFAAMTMQAIAKQPDLADCDASSVILAALEAAQIGLEPTGAIGGAWLVGFRTNVGTRQSPKWEKRAQLILDYRGVQHLIREGGGGEVKAVAVFEGDHFRAIEGTHPRIEHEPAFETTDPTKLRYVYAYPLNNPTKFEVMTKEQIDGIRARSKSPNSGPWVTDYVQQARKTVIKRLANYLPLKPTHRALIVQDSEREFGEDVAPSETVMSRTAAVKEQLRQRLTAGDPETAQDAPGADVGSEAANQSAPTVSASQQPEPAPTERADGVESPAMCGAESDPQLGPVEVCDLEPGHKGPHKGPEAIWPNRGS